MRAVVTGATGCVGRNLVDELLAENWKVVVLHRKSSDLSRLQGCAVQCREADLFDENSVKDAIEEGVDAVFHVAANTSHWSKEAPQQWKDNVLATRNLVEAALTRKVKRLIFTSTGATLPYQGADEKLTMQIPVGYIRTKRLAELELFKAMPRGLDAVILHPIIVVGAYDFNSYSQIFSGLKSGEIKAAFPGRIAFCHARDVARAHVEAYKRGRSFEGYVLGGTYTTWLDVFQRISARVGCIAPTRALTNLELRVGAFALSTISAFTGKRPALTRELVDLLHDAPDVSFSDQRKAKTDLGYQSSSLDSMIDDCYEWMVSNGLLK